MLVRPARREGAPEFAQVSGGNEQANVQQRRNGTGLTGGSKRLGAGLSEGKEGGKEAEEGRERRVQRNLRVHAL